MQGDKPFRFSKQERAILFKLGQAAIPPGKRFPPFDEAVIDRLETALGKTTRTFRRTYLSVIWIIEKSAYARYLKPYSKLPTKKAARYIEWWMHASSPQRLVFRLATVLLKSFYYDNPRIFEMVGAEYRKEPPAEEEEKRWLSQLMPGEEIHEPLELEAEVIVIGTGAGGAVVAAELAERGDAVVMIEEGDYHSRSEFTGRPMEMQQLMYRNQGFTTTMGNTAILIPSGRAVGGTTVVNSGTCFRTPDNILNEWGARYGLTSHSPKAMESYFQRVEAVYRVTPAEMKYVGANGELIAKGAERLGFSHSVLPRCAPDCDGQGVCAFGCPTDAKRSMNVTYVPRALKAGAFCLAGVKAERLLIEKGEIRGIQARALKTNQSVQVKAKTVVLAMGAYQTPLFLMKHRIGNSSGQLGKNLSIHPAGGVGAEVAERIEAWKTIPQGYMVDEFKDEGIVLEGISAPIDLASMVLMAVGKPMQEIMENYTHLATFGFMIRDTSRGSVRPTGTNIPLVPYHLNKTDVKAVVKAVMLLSRIYLEAGAERVHVPIYTWKPMHTPRDLEDNLKARVNAWDLDLSAYHPLGTCHMGAGSKQYVTDPMGELYDMDNLFIADGSAIPPAIGVNPQITISANATRIADFIHERLKRM